MPYYTFLSCLLSCLILYFTFPFTVMEVFSLVLLDFNFKSLWQNDLAGDE